MVNFKSGIVKLVFWFTLGLLLATLFEQETVVKIAAVVWLVMVVCWAGYALFWRWCLKQGKTEVRWDRKQTTQCNHRAHSIHCLMLARSPGPCDCVPSHPVNCGHCK